MAATTAPPTAVLEGFYSLAAAAVRLGLREPEDTTTKGEKALRDGVNLNGWPHHRIGRVIVFSDSDLAEIAAMHRAPRRAVRRRTVSRPTASAA